MENILWAVKKWRIYLPKKVLDQLYTFRDQGMAALPATEFPSKLAEARSFGSSIYNIFYSKHLL